MSEFHFAVSRTRLPARTVVRRDRIARSVAGRGAAFVQIREPDGRWLSWASIPGLGDPFDRSRAKAVQDAWKKAGV